MNRTEELKKQIRDRGKLILGVTEENEIIEVEVEQPTENHKYFSMTGNIASPITEKEAKKFSKSYWEGYFEESPEYIEEMNERMGTRFRTPKSASKFVIDTDGELHGFDATSFGGIHDLKYKRKNWLFQTSSAGQTGIPRLKKQFVSNRMLRKLDKTWKKHHLKNRYVPLKLPEQDAERVLKKAIKEIMRKNKGIF